MNLPLYSNAPTRLPEEEGAVHAHEQQDKRERFPSSEQLVVALLVRMFGLEAIPAPALSLGSVLPRCRLFLDTLVRLRPDLPRLPMLAGECAAQACTLQALGDPGRDGSRSHPTERNASFGGFAQYPEYSVLTGFAPKEHEALVGYLLAVWLGPLVIQRLENVQTPIRNDEAPTPSQRNEDSRLLTMLRSIPDPVLAKAFIAHVQGLDLHRARELPVPAQRGALQELCRSINRRLGQLHALRPVAPAKAITPSPVSSLQERIEAQLLANPESEGAAPDDCGASELVLPVDGRRGDQDSVLSASRALVAHGLKAAHAPSNLQWLPLAQVQPLAQALAQAVATQEDSQNESIVLLQLQAVTTVDPRLLFEAPLLGDLASLDAQRASTLHFCRSEDRLLLVVPRGELPMSYTQRSDAPGQHQYLGAVVLGLPRLLCDWLKRTLVIENDTIRLRCPDALRRLDVARLSLGSQLNIHLNESRVRNLMAAQALRQLRSGCSASLALPAANIFSGTLAYYHAKPLADILEAHRELLEKLYPGQTRPLSDAERGYLGQWAGCQLIPRPGDVRNAIQEAQWALGRGLRALPASRQLACEQFNAFSRYTYLLLRLTTAARPSEDAFALPQDLDTRLQLAQISDKVANSLAATRLVPLTEMACEQVRQYRLAVEWMAREVVAEDDVELAGCMLSTLPGAPDWASLPPHIVLDCENGRWSARGMDWTTERLAWGQNVPWPANFNRALMVQHLSQSGVPDELIQAMLGHAVGSFIPGSPDCPLVMTAIHAQLRPLQDSLASRLGLRVMAWPHRPSEGPSKDIPVIAADRPRFGDFNEQRVKSRYESALRQHHVSAALLQVARERLPAERILPRVEALLRERMREASPAQQARALATVHRLVACRGPGSLERLFNSKAKVRRRLLACSPPPSPLGRLELTALHRGEQLRNALLRALEQETPTAVQACPDQALAWIVLSAMAAGAAVAPDFIAFFSQSISQAYAEGPWLWIETECEGQSRRWVADPLTAALVHAYLKRWPGHVPCDAQGLRRRVAQLLVALPGPTRDLKPSAALTLATTSLTAWYRYHLPGNLLAHATGLRPSVPLPRESLAREAGRWIDWPSATGAPALATAAPATLESPFGCGHQIRLAGSLKGLLASVGIAPSGPRATHLHMLEQEVAALSAANAGTELGDARRTMMLGYVARLLRDGGRVKRHLSERTLAAYIAPVRQVLLGPHGADLLLLDTDEIEAVYRDILLAGGRTDRRRRGLALSMFHEFLMAAFGVDPVRWAVVTQGLAIGQAKVDANVVWPRELERAIALLQAGWGGDPLLAEMAQGVICLMRFAGARFSEAYSRRDRDFTCGDYLRIVPALGLGPLKTEASRREVALDDLPNWGREVLDRLRHRARLRGGPGWLFADPEAPKDLVGRSRLAGLVGQVLRAATGNPAIHAHHLRHTFVTTSYDELVAPIETLPPERMERRQARLGTTEPTRSAMAEWAICNGHASPETGHRVYLHQQERRVMRAASALLPAGACARLACALGQASSAAEEQTAPPWQTDPLPALAPWRGLAVGEPPNNATLLSQATIAPQRGRLPLEQLHRLLTHPAKHWLPVERFVELWCQPPCQVRRLLEAECAIHEEIPIKRGALPLVPPAVLPGAGRLSKAAAKLPPGHRLLNIRALDSLPSQACHLRTARTVLRQARAGNSWSGLTEAELRSAVSWLARLGLGDSWLLLEVPDGKWKRWCRAQEVLAGLSIKVVRTRRQPRLTITSDTRVPLGGAAKYFTLLWLIRSEAELN